MESLPPDQRSRIIRDNPKAVGNLNGIPAVDRDKANRIQLNKDKMRIITQLREAGISIPASSQDIDPVGASQVTDPISHTQRSDPQKLKLLSEARNVLAADEALHMNTAVRPVLYAYDPSAFNDPTFGYEGKVAIALGDVDHAKNVAVNLSGLRSNAGKVPGKITDENRMYKIARNSATGGYATMYWQGYPAPQQLDVATDDNARSAAPALQADVHALRVLNPHAYTGVVGHSYGSLVTGIALKNGMSKDVNYAAIIGSPGTDAANVGELGMQDKPVYVGSASRDPVTTVAQAFGHDPASQGFGAVRFKAEATDRQGFSLEDHSKYYDYIPGTQRPSESLRALSLITSGHGDQLQLHGLRASDRYLKYRHSWSREPQPPSMEDPEYDRKPNN